MDNVELWNVKNLQAPPVNTCKTSLKEIDARIFFAAIKDGLTFFDQQKHLHTEAALLSRCIYRMKKKFRSSKDMQFYQKLNTCLLKYLQMNITSPFNMLNMLNPPKCIKDAIHMPTKNMLDYLLLRLQGLGKLICRVLDICKLAAEQAQLRLRTGHFWRHALIFYGIISRLFVIAKRMIKFVCEVYQKLEPFSSKLGNPGDWSLLRGYIMPCNLGEWLGIDWIDLNSTVIEIPDDDDSEMPFFNLMYDSDDSDVQIMDEYILVGNPSPVTARGLDTDIIIALDDTKEDDDCDAMGLDSNNDSVSVLRGFQDDADLGEVVPTKRKKKHDSAKKIINSHKRKTLNGSSVNKDNAAPKNKNKMSPGQQPKDQTESNNIKDDDVILLNDSESEETPKNKKRRLSLCRQAKHKNIKNKRKRKRKSAQNTFK